jgi:uncharacterized protein (TIGR00369 family)
VLPDLVDSGVCFVCGPRNPHSLGLTVERGEGVARTRYTPSEAHQGYAGVIHGGLLATVADEVMAHAAATTGRLFATAEMTVRFHRAIAPGEEVVAAASVAELRARMAIVECRLTTTGGALILTGSAKMLPARRPSAPPARG